jgi:TonB-dependent SusC/RagA subfamily outer membrane receptor
MILSTHLTGAALILLSAVSPSPSMSFSEPALHFRKATSPTLSRRYSGTISGTVTDAASQRPLANAQVYVVGSSNVSVADESGHYTLASVAPGRATVRVRLLGYESVDSTVVVADGQSLTLNFALSARALSLDEVVVTGTPGQARRREIGNSISTVDAQALQVQPIRSAEDALAGQVAGVTMISNAGIAGAGSTIRIRGINSLTQGNRPLIYVDGVRLYNQDYPETDQEQAASPLNDINPEDIARIEVIKGAAATTLYGTEASSGVIQIFTKQGLSEEGGAHWTAKVSQGINILPQIGPDEGQDWFERYGPKAKGLFMDQWTRTGWNQSYNLSVSGKGSGDLPIDYFLSGGWKNDQGVLPDQGAKGTNLRGNLSFRPLKQVTLQFNNAYTGNDIRWLPGGNLANGFTLNVMRGPFDYTNDRDSVFLNQYLALENQNHFTSGLNVTVTPTDHLSAKVVVGLDYLDSDYTETYDFGNILIPDGTRQDRRFRNINKQIDLQATYARDVFGISTSTSAGFQMFDGNQLTVNGQSARFAGPGSPTLNTGSQQNVSESRLRVINAGYFVQELLGFADRLFITGGLRIDGNSAFGESYGLQAYPKVSASYVISDEGFWPDWLEATKLRVAYGESGKAPGYFDAQRVWTPISTTGGEPGVTPLTRGNPDLGPERSRELEAGVEVSALDSRVQLDASFFTQKTMDALMAVPQDPSTGYLSGQIANAGVIENHGYEIKLSGTPIRTASFSWQLGLTAAGTRSKMAEMGSVTELFVGASLSPGMWVKLGYPVPSYFGPKLTNPDEIGAPKVVDAYYGPMYPTHSYRISSTFNIGERLTVFGLAEYQGGAYMASHTAWRNVQRKVWPPCLGVVKEIEAGHLDQLTASERYYCNPSESPYGAYISPTDFWRLRSLELSYHVPSQWLRGMGDWYLSVGGRNLFTSTKYVGLDPEVTVGGETFARHEYYQTPIPRTFVLSVRSNF